MNNQITFYFIFSFHCEHILVIRFIDYVSQLSRRRRKKPYHLDLTSNTFLCKQRAYLADTSLTVSTKQKNILIKRKHFILCLHSSPHFVSMCLHVSPMCWAHEPTVGGEALLFLWRSTCIKAIRSRWMFISWNQGECLTLILREISIQIQPWLL